VRVKLVRNIEAYGGEVGLVTVTAPGADVLPWTSDHERTVQRHRARAWNKQAVAQWRAIHRKAAQRAARHAKRSGGSWRIVCREWEFQGRGVLHMHVVTPMGTPLERMASNVYASALEEMRHEHGFGFVDRGKRKKGTAWRREVVVIPQEQAARYLAKYVAGVKSDGRLAISETVSHPDTPGHVVYVGRHLTARTGCTMQTLRLRRRAHMMVRAAHEEGVDLDELDVIDAWRTAGVSGVEGLDKLLHGP
jgi:hypothetical protein